VKFLPPLLFLVFLFFNERDNAQPAPLSVDRWVKKLADPKDQKNAWYEELYAALQNIDSSKTFIFLDKLASDPSAKGNYFLARFKCLKSEMIYQKDSDPAKTWLYNNEPAKKEILNSLADAMQKSYECNDDYLAAYVSGVYGRYLSFFGETEPAVMYLINSADLYEKIHLPAKYSIYVVVGEMLWRVREYEKSLKYSRKALDVLDTSHFELRNDYFTMCNNTVALDYHRMGKFDSALYYYSIGLDMARKTNNVSWQGFISGNIGQIYFAQEKYTNALQLFTYDYTISNQKEYFDNAANSLQWTARTNLALGNTGTALRQIRTVLGLLKKRPVASYLQSAYFTASEIFKALKESDSLLYYSVLYNNLRDSLDRAIYQSSISISRLRLDDERSRFSILKLQREKENDIQQRNLIIAVILFLAVLSILVINRQRLRSKYRQQLAEQEKLRVEQEMESARVELKMFTRNIVEKTLLIEGLEQRLKAHEYNADEYHIIEELSNQTILTEDDWLKFKLLFEKTHPGFFIKLRERFPDITPAEQRMASLTRLRLTTKQIASMLGISVDSVHKSRQRLRMRFQVGTDTNLDELVASL
jgi:hypothetical protein